MIGRFSLRTTSRNQFLDVSKQVEAFIRESAFRDGFCVVYTPHTTAAVTVNENADPSVKSDLIRKLEEVFPQEDNYRHAEGNSDAHIKSSLIGCSETLIVAEGQLVLGTWQGIYFCEFDGPRQRQYLVKLVAG